MLHLKYLRHPGKRTSLLGLFALCLLPLQSSANSIVRVETAFGGFSLELFDNLAPDTVANFLNYVSAGRYNSTFIHESVNEFIQGGSFRYSSCAQGITSIELDPPIAQEITGLSNTHGTIAMARGLLDTDGFTSQWRINLSNNSSSDGDSVVFGQVIGDGLNLILAINGLRNITMNIGISVPVINFNDSIANCNLTGDNLVQVMMSVEFLGTGTDIPANSFDESSGLLNLKVDAGETGLVSVSFSLNSTDPSVVIQALPDTVATLSESVPNMAIFDAVTGQLVIPELAVEDVVAFRDVVFVLSDADNLLFTLESFVQQ
ncbi:MAG: peptidylprolyl isomerase [Gammaproteobacteria bacterium]|jgi:cyclophilin family peptidyl-prolyl cis-trans isomerase|nr:hypothetical protein [Gammaproteobacteria bacterium]MDP6095774.1 peptidylprolyl isomerase [Gammaproteobacteria bacterium]MDP7456201.1 peptidylprolyl isomerase [Gammaproteobacteria bacterium]|tara:strand:+ start:4088 stop:5041 length:954 start_codon:yes stop_codon:yes gene_type:complete